MTRLTPADLDGLAGALLKFDSELKDKCGCNLRQLACRAIGIPEESLISMAGKTPVSVIPVTSGEGVIAGFVETIQAIGAHLGFPVRITGSADVAGLAEAYAERAAIITLADDRRYIAVNLKTLFIAENTYHTAKGFVTALELMACSLKERRVLIIGCGSVGSCICRLLLEHGARVALYDVNSGQSLRLALDIEKGGSGLVHVEAGQKPDFCRYDLIVDACPAPDIIDQNCVTERTYIVAPGVPSGVTGAAQELLAKRYLHDPLLIGTAVMLLSAACSPPISTL